MRGFWGLTGLRTARLWLCLMPLAECGVRLLQCGLLQVQLHAVVRDSMEC